MLEWIISSSVLLLVVIGLRFALRGRLRPQLQYALWALVLLRLLLPVSFGSASFSAGNAAQALEQSDYVQQLTRETPSFQEAYQQVSEDYAQRGLDVTQLNPAQRQEMAQQVMALQEPRPDVKAILAWCWLGGAALLAVLLLAANLRFFTTLRRSRRVLAVDAPVPVYLTAAVESPCLFGLLHPAVYLTPEAAEDDTLRRCSVAHELSHLRHGDHIWALLRCLCLVLHWYNPLVWWAASLSRRDGELACDEATIARLGEGQRTAYGRALLQMTCQKHASPLVTATSMTGSGIRERIHSIVRKPRTAVCAAILLVLLLGAAVGCTFTGSGNEEPEQPPVEEPGQDTEVDSFLEEHPEYRALTEEELTQVDAYLRPGDGQELPAYAGFVRRFYTSPTEIELIELLRYCPLGQGVNDEAEYQALKQVEGWHRGEDATLDDSPTPVHRYQGSEVDELLLQYAGITRADLTKEQTMLYQPANDCYYNFTSDAWFPDFVCTRGYVDGDQVVLYDDHAYTMLLDWNQETNAFDRIDCTGRQLTLRQAEDGRWLFVSFQPVEV